MIARFNERITVQKNTVSVDKVGNHMNTWENHFSCFAYASTYQYDAEKGSEVIRQEQTVSFEVRYCPELKNLDSTRFRILFRGNVYGIESVDFMNYQRKMIRIRTKLDTAARKEVKT